MTNWLKMLTILRLLTLQTGIVGFERPIDKRKDKNPTRKTYTK